jgi:perosamine synthetase
MQNIPITRTEFTEEEFLAIHKPLRSGWVVQGSFVKEFEDKWAAFTAIKNSIATTSCTTALHLTMAALGIGTGDEVIVPAFTWVATANAVEALNAKPVFCDIDIETFNINPDLIEERITPKTRAIIPVHLFGLPCEMDRISEIARKHNLLIIEDAACGFGARYKGTHVGGFGQAGCFSFHPRKAITTGEGGMITTNDDRLASRLRMMRDHGANISDHQRHMAGRPYALPEFPHMGFNYRMTDIQASIGVTQMDRADSILKGRLKWADRYNEVISKIEWLQIPFKKTGYEHGFQAYVCLFTPEPPTLQNVSRLNDKRNCFMDYLQTKGISTRPGTHAVHMLEYYVKKYSLQREDYPNAFIADQCSIAFPLFPSLLEEEFNHIINCIVNH